MERGSGAGDGWVSQMDTPSARVKFSVVIATFDRPAELTRCMRAIAELRYPRNEFEVIVVNDGGPRDHLDRLTDLVGDIHLKIVSTPNAGPGAARNAGAAVARGEFLAFIDDDCVPPPDWLIKLSSAVEQHPDALIGGHTLNALTGNLFSQASQTLVDYVYAYYNEPGARRNMFFASNNMTLSADAFRAMGGFDEAFRTAEDRELCNRWWASGGEFRYLPEIVMNHAHRLNLLSLHRQHFGYGRGALPYWQKSGSGGVRGINVEPFSFYVRMLGFPFKKGDRFPAIVSALILFSQVSNAAGFAYEGMRRVFARERAPILASKTRPNEGVAGTS